MQGLKEVYITGLKIDSGYGYDISFVAFWEYIGRDEITMTLCNGQSSAITESFLRI